MITDNKKVLVKMVFKNDDIFEFRRAASCDREYEYRDDEEYDEELDDFDIDVEFEDEDTSEQGESRLADDAMQIVTEGYLYKKDGRVVLRYAEADSTDLANEFTVLSYEQGIPEILTMERNGMCRTVMVFEEGRRYLSMYSVSGMSMDLVVRTYELENTLTLENGGEIRLGYTLENGGSTVSSVKMTLSIELL